MTAGIVFEYDSHILLNTTDNIILMATTNYLLTWPPLLPESKMTVHTGKLRQNKSGLVKHMGPPAPPDQVTIQKLNELAAKPPFCALHKVKKHEML